MDATVEMHKEAAGSPVETHRIVIVEEVARSFGTEPGVFLSANKTVSPFSEIAALAAFLLERDTAASCGEIGSMFSCPPCSVRACIKRISGSVDRGSAAILEKMSTVSDAVCDRIGENNLTWHRSLSPRLRRETELPKKVQDALRSATLLGLDELRGTLQSHDLVKARDIAFFLFITYAGMKRKQAGQILGRDQFNVAVALKRMRDPDSERLRLLRRVCAILAIDSDALLQARE